MAGPEQVLLDATRAYDGAAQLRAAGVKWGAAWAGHSANIAGLEASARFGDDETGRLLRQNYRAGSQGLSRAAAAVSEGCKMYADSCSSGVAMVDDSQRQAAARLRQD